MTSKTSTLAQPTQKSSFTPIQTGLLQRKCACGNSSGLTGKCSECQKKKLSLQRRAVNNQAESSEVPPIVHEVLRSPGQPLDGNTRTFMESRFGHDFSQVRVHTDEKAAKSAQSVNALAYTVGPNVVFGKGEYTPSTTAGKRLLAHELTHTIQQSAISSISSSVLQTLRMSEPSNHYEREADFVANQIANGARRPSKGTISAISGVGQTLWRQPIEELEVNEDISGAISETGPTEIELGDEAVELQQAGCTGSRRLDHPNGIANFDTIDFTVQSPCRRVRVSLTAQWDCVGCEFGPDSYTVSVDGTTRSMPAGNRGIEEECTGTPPKTRFRTFSVSPGSHRLRISTGRSPDSTCKLVIRGFMQIRR